MSHDRGVAQLVGPDRGWVYTQIVLLAVVLAAGPIEAMRRRRWALKAVTIVPATALMAASALVASNARSELAASFTMSPTPDAAGNLVETGIYRRMRHPMYLSVMLLLTGYALIWRSRVAAGGCVVAITFLAAKTRHEERLLRIHYPGYPAYERRVPSRFVPGIF